MRELACFLIWVTWHAPLSPADASGPSSRPAAAWRQTPDGQVAVVRLPSAPFPHSSRADGYTTRTGEHFPADPNYVDDSVGIVVPAGYRPGARLDVVVHFHGHRNHVERVLEHFRLPAELRASGLNAVLIVPQGPRDAPDSGFGRLEEAGGLPALVNDVAALLAKEGIVPAAEAGAIVLTAHSGGYRAAAACVADPAVAGRITDVLLLDATYGGLERFADWCGGDAGRRLVSLYTEHLADENEALRRLLGDRGVPVATRAGPDVPAGQLAARGATFVDVRPLGHNELVSSTGYYAKLLATTRPSRAP